MAITEVGLATIGATEAELETIEVGWATIEATGVELETIEATGVEIEAAGQVTAVETVEAEAVIASATKARRAQADLEG